MARQADDAHVEGEVLAAELGADPGLAAPPRAAALSSSTSRKAWPCSLPAGGQAVEVAGAEASFTVLRLASAEVPPITKAR